MESEVAPSKNLLESSNASRQILAGDAAEHNENAVSTNALNGINGVNPITSVAETNKTPEIPDLSSSNHQSPHAEAAATSTSQTPPLDHELELEPPIPPPKSEPILSQPISDIRTTNTLDSSESVIETKALESGLSQQPGRTSLNSDPPSTAVQSMNLDGPSDEVIKPDLGPASATITENPDSSIAQQAHESPTSKPDEPMLDALSDATVAPALQIQPTIEGPDAPGLMEGVEPQITVEAADTRSLPKVSHPRDDDEFEAEPATKRPRAGENTSTVPEFKMPDPPATQNAVQSSPVGADVTKPAQTGTPAVETSPVPEVSASQDPKGLLPLPTEREPNPDYDLPMTKAQQKHLQRGVTNAKKSQHASAFNVPVDPIALNIPTYFDVIKEPMDLRTIDTKLKNDQYTTARQYLDDFDRMVSNAVQFNGVDHPITQHAFHLRISVDRNLQTFPSHEYVEPTAAEKKAKKAAAPRPTQRRESRSSLGTAKSPTSATQQTFALGPSGIPTIRRDSTVADGRPRREIHPPAPKDLPYSASKPKRKKFQSELKFCDEILKEWKKPKFSTAAWPFLVPVDPVALNIPTYHKVIKKPMDISTIEKKLNAGQYENAKEFEQDVRLMLTNCYKFNPPEHTVHQAGKQFEKAFDEQWARKSKWLREHAPSSGAQSQGSSPDLEDDDEDDEEEDIDEEEDHNASQIAELQRSIEAMAKQVATLQQKKKSPPVSNKKGKTGKTSKKDAKKIASKPPKKTKKDKIHAISYEEKMSLSDRISDLAEPQMQMVINIIRNAMPRLGGLNDDEVELDIDELPPDVLHKLNQFVKKHTGPNEHRSSTGHATAPGSTRPKKNKPMSKTEQEAKIQEIRGKLSGLDGKSGAKSDSPEDSSQALANEDSSEDEDSSESEED